MALGARPADLLGIVMSKGFVLTLAGIGVGVMIALGSTHLMGDMLYKTSPGDPESFGSAFAIMAVPAPRRCRVLCAGRSERRGPIQRGLTGT
jgi:ABC-type antimicrobial peptide transport system permease subunit